MLQDSVDVAGRVRAELVSSFGHIGKTCKTALCDCQSYSKTVRMEMNETFVRRRTLLEILLHEHLWKPRFDECYHITARLACGLNPK